MIRILADYVLPILLPTVLWVLWLAWRQRHAGSAGGPQWDSVPWSWLLIAGGVLALVITFGGVLVSGYSTGHYHPARVDDHGKIIPGGFD